MVTYILLAIISVFLAHKAIESGSSNRLKRVLLLSLMFFMVSGFLSLLTFMPYAEPVEKQLIPISLNDNMGTSGKFWIGSGNIGSEAYITFYHKEEGSNEIGLVHVPKKRVTLLSSDTISFTKKYYVVDKDHFWNKYFATLKRMGNLHPRKNDVHYTVSIPDSVIKNQFYLDSK